MLRGVSEISKRLLEGVRHPGKESCAQEHQDSLLRDCVGKSQQVSVLVWLPATFPSTSQSSVWAAGSAWGLCQWQGSQLVRVRGGQAVRNHLLELLWRGHKCSSLALAKTSTLGKKTPLPAHQPLWFDLGKWMQSFDCKIWCYCIYVAYFHFSAAKLSFYLDSYCQPAAAVMLAQSTCSIPVEHITKSSNDLIWLLKHPRE